RAMTWTTAERSPPVKSDLGVDRRTHTTAAFPMRIHADRNNACPLAALPPGGSTRRLAKTLQANETQAK
ncbi:hypothetical protein L6V77_35110, partial [Myxococcota bacterium]|nr:hypothetical protein [Myxococcota bacterium]